MKIATCTVSLEGFGDPSWADKHLSLLTEVLNESRDLQVDMLCLPGGYLMANSISERDKFSHIIRNEAKKYKIAIAIGIDTDTKIKKDPSQDWSYRIKQYTLPWFAICCSPNNNVLHTWRQRSVTSNDQWNSSDVVCAEVRALPVLKRYVEVLMCGEIFNERIRNNIIARKRNPAAVVDLGHIARGFRVWAGMKKLSQGGLNVLCSAHANKKKAMKYCYTASGCKSTRSFDRIFHGPPRLELKVWSFN